MKFDVGNRSRLAWLALAAELIICAAVYAPGLHGSFVFDDSTFIIANKAMHVTTLRLGDWVAAALSFPSSHQGRWLGMLSFAVNHYFTGLDPFWLKLTNLAIHLVNGVLVFGMFRALFALWRECRADLAARHPFDARMAAAALAGLWLLLPINVTAVLYVSQRLESLSNTFVFVGLWWYLHARRLHWRGEAGPIGLWASLVVSTGIGVLVKESAAMLPLYALCAEFALSRGRNRDGRPSRAIAALYGTLIGLPLFVGGVWLMSWIGSASSYARPFGTIERLMTESRVLLDYIRWTLLPQPEALTLYHDDIAVSHGLLDPPSTLAALAALLALLVVAVWQRARRPLFTLGVLWFFTGHVLTGTVIPLMLAFEHRNYFPSVGMLLSVSSLAAFEGALGPRRAQLALAAGAFAFYAFVTWMRAEEWSDPLRLALSEASKRPDSSAAQCELAGILLHSYKNGASKPMTREAYEVLDRAYRLPGSDIVAEELLIVAHAGNRQAIDPTWWDSLIRKLESRTPSTSDISALSELWHCAREDICKDSGSQLHRAFSAAISHPNPDSVLISAYGEFAEGHLRDSMLAERLFREALLVAPSDPTTHANIVTFLIHHVRFDEARAELDTLRRMNHFGSLDERIAELDAALREGASHVAATPTSGMESANTPDRIGNEREEP
jgi:hypothetical protein